jgi:secreted trypsin-like serine protease
MKNTRKSLIVVTVVLAIALGSVGIAYAITYGEPDGDGHPYVGMVAFYDEDGEYLWRCSGTLLSPTILLTAGHCTFGTTSAKVRFDSEITDLDYPFADGVPGTPYPHPQYDDYWTEFPKTYDVGVVVLEDPVDMDTCGELPELGVLDDLDTQRGHQDLVLRTVGYGLQSVKPDYQADRTRYTSTSLLVNLRSNLTKGYNLHTSNNPGKGHGTSGGSCFGDSGGPIFYPEGSNVVVGIVSFGMNWNCKGGDWAFRTDIETTQDFVNGFLK